MENPGPDEAMEQEEEELDRDRDEAGRRPDIPRPTVELLAGLPAGLRLAGRPG
ncbi:hypothetical protein [Brevundimonas sp.]|uniref:hypothetical protein n=1 Tax=Brevundimonas sp. TaxID=1871086 RepID=UPI0028996A12|nr:hypothetical protein [Brevundimonas sp.]